MIRHDHKPCFLLSFILACFKALFSGVLSRWYKYPTRDRFFSVPADSFVRAVFLCLISSGAVPLRLFRSGTVRAVPLMSGLFRSCDGSVPLMIRHDHKSCFSLSFILACFKALFSGVLFRWYKHLTRDRFFSVPADSFGRAVFLCLISSGAVPLLCIVLFLNIGDNFTRCRYGSALLVI